MFHSMSRSKAGLFFVKSQILNISAFESHIHSFFLFGFYNSSKFLQVKQNKTSLGHRS